MLVDELAAGLAREDWDIDDRQRVGAFQHERTAQRQAHQRRFRPQHRQRAEEAAKIEDGSTLLHVTRLHLTSLHVTRQVRPR